MMTFLPVESDGIAMSGTHAQRHPQFHDKPYGNSEQIAFG
jgi:hypothetical protein